MQKGSKVRRRQVVLAVLVALVLVTVGGALAWRVLGGRSAYEQAVSSLPGSTLRATYTDWSQVRTLARGTALGPGSSQRQVDEFANRAYDKDLVSTSAVTESTYALEHLYGFSPLQATWEIYGQSRRGAVDVMHLDDSVDMAGVERNLRRLGYREPGEGSESGGVWAGGVDLVASLDPSLTPVQQNVVVLPDERLVLMSDTRSYAASAAAVVRGDDPSLIDTAGVSDLAELPEEPVSAVLWASDFACEDLSMANADQEDQRLADDLVARAGGINPLSGMVMAEDANEEVLVGMHFESSDQASDNLQPRVDLASGEAPGQGGTFAERFRVTSAERTGDDVVLTFAPVDQPVLSDLSQGPVLFATC